jgi:hypothetical protein
LNGEGLMTSGKLVITFIFYLEILYGPNQDNMLLVLCVGRKGSVGPWPPGARRAAAARRSPRVTAGTCSSRSKWGRARGLALLERAHGRCAGGADAGHGVTLARAPVAGGV